MMANTIWVVSQVIIHDNQMVASYYYKLDANAIGK